MRDVPQREADGREQVRSYRIDRPFQAPKKGQSDMGSLMSMRKQGSRAMLPYTAATGMSI